MKSALGARKALLAFVLLGAANLAAASIANADELAGASACDRLASAARAVPATAWTQGEKALRPALVIETSTSSPSGAAARILSLPEVRDEIGVSDVTAGFISRLPGTNVYLASTFGGTLHCQSAVFVEIGPGGKPAILGTASAGGEEGLCWNQTGDVGTVFGRPAYIEHGTTTGFSIDEEIHVTPWTGSGWGRTCSLRLDFLRVFTLKSRYCGDRDVCRAGADTAVTVATQYNRYRDRDWNLAKFSFGAGVTEAAKSAVERAKANVNSHGATPEFPIFGAERDPYIYGFSYTGFTFFPLILGGKPYVGAIGRNGVGWRENDQTLVAIFGEDKGALNPLASFVVDLSNGGLTKTSVGDPGPVREETSAPLHRGRSDTGS